jgi:hypothetical protein
MRLKLKRSQRMGATVGAVPLSMRLVTPSIPAAELVLSLEIKEQTSSMEQLQRDMKVEIS